METIINDFKSNNWNYTCDKGTHTFSKNNDFFNIDKSNGRLYISHSLRNSPFCFKTYFVAPDYTIIADYISNKIEYLQT